jgi:hypothetical protein
MPLSKDILGLALYNKAMELNDIEIDESDIDQARRDFWNAVADEIIKHFIANIKLTIPGTGLIAPSGGGPVTGVSITGTIQ